MNSGSKNSDVLVIGGGVIGLSSAYFLGKAGHQVTVLDRDESRRESCSEKNAGMVVPSHFIPLAAPGVIGQGLKWMLNRRSPFYLRPRLDPKLWSWCWQFFRHSNARHVAGSRELLRDLSLESRRLFLELADELEFDLATRGLMMLCRTQRGLDEEAEVAEQANELGIDAEVCDADRVRQLDPDAAMDVAGGVWFGQDCHLDPTIFLAKLRESISRRGGKFVTGEAADFKKEGDQIVAVSMTDGDEIEANEFVIAGGVWSSGLSKKLSLKLPMQGGKGYSFTLREPREIPRLCSLLKEGRVAVTPMGDSLRVAGTMEICGNDLSIDRHRLAGIVSSFCEFFPEFREADFDGLEPWSGLRPCSPDGLPFIGQVPHFKNVTVNTGHAMLGLSLGPISGKLAAEIVSGQSPSIEISKLKADRFS